MIRIHILVGLIVVFSAEVLCAGAPAMIEKHIFTPEIASADNEEIAPPAPVPTSAALEKELLFTGVLITPKGKMAMITETIKNERKKQKHVLTEGDQVKGMMVSEIGPNYVLLAAKESSTRLNLYKGAKLRPAPIAEPVKSDVPQPMAQQAVPKAQMNNNMPVLPQGAPKENEVTSSPFGGGPKPGEAVPNSPSTAKNPFTEILNQNQPMRPRNMGNVPPRLPLNVPPETGN